MPKSSKRFVISNSGLNGQGFRMLTEGADLSDFDKNPLLLFNHIRPEGSSKDQILPIGYWVDIELKGDDITGVPFFDDKDEFAMSIYNKVEGGFIRMCSAGAEPLATSEASEHLLPGQQKATVTKWKLKEGSICDIGANPGSLAVALYSNTDTRIELSSIPNLKLNMDPEEKDKEKVTLSEEEKDAEIARLKAELEDLKAKMKLADDEKQLKLAEEEEKKVENLVSTAIGQRKITLAQKETYVKLAKADFASVSALLGSMKAAPSVQESLNTTKTDTSKLELLAAKSYDELFKDGGLEQLKLHAPDTYKLKFKEKFGKEPRN